MINRDVEEMTWLFVEGVVSAVHHVPLAAELDRNMLVLDAASFDVAC